MNVRVLNEGVKDSQLRGGWGWASDRDWESQRLKKNERNRDGDAKEEGIERKPKKIWRDEKRERERWCYSPVLIAT